MNGDDNVRDPVADMATALVAAVGTDAWPEASARFAALLAAGDPERLGRAERLLAQTAAAIESAGPDAHQVRGEQVAVWQRRLAGLVTARPQDLRDVGALAHLVYTRLPAGARAWWQHNSAAENGTVFAVQGGDQHVYYQQIQYKSGAGPGTIAAVAGASAAGGAAGGVAAATFASRATASAGPGAGGTVVKSGGAGALPTGGGAGTTGGPGTGGVTAAGGAVGAGGAALTKLVAIAAVSVATAAGAAYAGYRGYQSLSDGDRGGAGPTSGQPTDRAAPGLVGGWKRADGAVLVVHAESVSWSGPHQWKCQSPSTTDPAGKASMRAPMGCDTVDAVSDTREFIATFRLKGATLVLSGDPESGHRILFNREVATMNGTYDRDG